MNYNIEIKGGGTDEEIAIALRCIVVELERGNHVASLCQFNKCEWEYPTLAVVISEDIEEHMNT